MRCGVVIGICARNRHFAGGVANHVRRIRLQVAVVNLQDTVKRPLHMEPECAPVLDLGSGFHLGLGDPSFRCKRVVEFVAVVFARLARDHRQRRRVGYPAEPSEHVPDEAAFPFDLVGVGEVLPGTPATVREVLAERRHASR